MNCPTCHTELPDDAQFCIECGAHIATASTGPTVQLREQDPHQVQCPVCGSINPMVARFCVLCGTTLQGGEVASVPAPLPPPVAPTSAPLQEPDKLMWLAGAILLGGGVLLLLTKMLSATPILILIGLAAFTGNARRRPQAGLMSLVWLFGLAILLGGLPRTLFVPGILILIALSSFVGMFGRGSFGRRGIGRRRHRWW